MKRPIDAYREGYNKGRADNFAGNLSEAVFGLLRDDPGGYYSAGYRDGAAGKPFRPPRNIGTGTHSSSRGRSSFWR